MEINKIIQRINVAKPLDFGTIFNNSIELFKKVWLQGLVTVLINMMLAIPFIFAVYIPLIFLGLFDVIQGSYDPYGYGYYSEPDVSPLVVILMLFIYFIAIAGISIVSFGLKAAFYRICKLKDLNENGKDDYFFFFKKAYVSKTLKLGLSTIGIVIIASLLCFFPVFYVIVPINYIYVVYAFNPDKSVSEIINLSFKLGNRKWLLTFGLMIVCGFLAGIVGMLMCFVGIYVTQSFAWLQPYLIYKEVVGFNGDYDDLKRISGLNDS